MEEDFYGWMLGFLLAGIPVVIMAFKWVEGMVESRLAGRMGICGESPQTLDCMEATRMMTGFVKDGLVSDGRALDECLEAGCDGFLTLHESKDIARLVCAAHEVGGRIVLRKVAAHDVECVANTELEVKRKLTGIDIRRARRIQRKSRR